MWNAATQVFKVLRVGMFFPLVSGRIPSDPEIRQGQIVPENLGELPHLFEAFYVELTASFQD